MKKIGTGLLSMSMIPLSLLLVLILLSLGILLIVVVLGLSMMQRVWLRLLSMMGVPTKKHGSI